MTSQPQPGRRRVLLGGAASAGALGVGAAAVGLDRSLLREEPTAPAPDPAPYGAHVVPFHGEHQAGVETPAPASAAFLGLDLAPGVDREGIIRLLRILTDDAERLTQGRGALADTEPEMASEPASLTITVGFGPGFLERADRTSPQWLAPLPDYAIDELEEPWTGAELLLQVAAEDPLTVAHATRMLLKDARTFTRTRWIQRGFRRSPGVQRPGTTMRNLFGQLDGSANPQLGTNHFATVVWIPDGPFAGGTSMVLRRIRMDLDGWDLADRTAREHAVGTRLDTGAPLTGGAEGDQPDFEALGPHGFPQIAEFAHLRRARGVDDGVHQEIYRRPYNYEDGGESGLLFASYQADLAAQYLPMQQRLADLDLLNEWTTPVGSAVFAIPPGCAEGEYLGQSVLG